MSKHTIILGDSVNINKAVCAPIKCSVCNSTYHPDPKRLKHNRQTTCSRKCSYILRANKLRNPLVEYRCPCGKVFIKRDTSIKTRCSKACRYKYLPPRPRRIIVPKPPKIYEYTCFLCNSSFRGKKRTKNRVFCSIKCYREQQSLDFSGVRNPMYGKSPKCDKSTWRSGWFTSLRGDRYFLKSSWEVAVARYLDLCKVNWRYEHKRYRLGSLTYVPDFFLLKGKRITKIIEVKGWIKPKDTLKIRRFRKMYKIPIEVWGRSKLKSLGLLDAGGYGKTD